MGEIKEIRLIDSASRRRVLGGGVAAGFLGVTSLSAQMLSAPTTSTPKLKVNITLGGATYSYPDGPAIPSYYVGFRNDGRIVFHLGALDDLTLRAPTIKPYHLGPHHVRIESNGSVLFDADIPAHWWNAEWTFRTTPIAVKRTPAQIVAANRMFPFGDTGVKVRPTANFTFTGPMDSAGITIYMPTTGERPDIGLITDPSALYMLGGSPSSMLAWAQAAGSCPLHFRDEKSGKPIDLLKYPSANAYDLPGLQGAPFLLKGTPDARAPQYSAYGGGWSPQQAHFCEMAGLAAMATEDDGLLEELQYQTNFVVLCNAYLSNQRRIATVSGEVRGVAWAFRQLFMAHVATKDREARGPLPQFLHPSSYFKKLLDQSLSYYTANMGGSVQRAFHLWGNDTGNYSPWMQDYLVTALAYGVLTGHADWADIFLFNLGNVIARTSGTSGWPPSLCTPYRIPTGSATTWAQSFDGLMTDPEVMLSKEAHDRILANPLNGGKLAPEEPYGYHFTTRAALVMADYLDMKRLANVRGTYPDFDTCLTNVERMFLAAGNVNARVSVVAKAASIQ